VRVYERVCCDKLSRSVRRDFAEDLAQDTLCDPGNAARYNGRCQFFTWLCGFSSIVTAYGPGEARRGSFLAHGARPEGIPKQHRYLADQDSSP